MGKKVRDKTTAFINTFDYQKTRSIKKALRAFLKLNSDAEMFGSEGAMIILTDIKSGLDMYNSPVKVLTDRQREAIIHCLINDLKDYEAAELMNISTAGVHSLITSGVKRIRDYLISGEMSRGVFTRAEEEEIKRLYREGKYNVEIAKILDKSPRTIKNKIRYMIATGKLEKRERH